MKFPLRLALIMSLMTLNSTGGLASTANSAKTSPAILRFSDIDYHHRWSKDDQHEFTPHNQPDLTRWSDMITINYYRRVKDGETLAAAASAVLETYKNNRAMVLKTDSAPRTKEKPAEHLMVVLFPRPDFIEAVFARFKIAGGVGVAVIYSHREYGNKIGDQMSAWLKKNGPATEKALMAWDQLPVLDQSKK
jgi:hypothetical protein